MALNHSRNFRADEEKRNFAESCAALEMSLGKLELVLREENSALEAYQSTDHSPYTARKNHILRELMVLQKADHSGSVVAAKSDRLREVRQLVDHNHRLLRAQIDAMSEVTNLLTQAAIAEGEDGTYTRKIKP